MELIYKRTCPVCKKEQIFKSKSGYENAVKNNRFCGSCSKIGKNNPMFGIYPSSITRKKISDFHLGRPKSEVHKKKLSEIRIKSGLSKGKNNPFYGKHHSDESKQKLSDSQLGPKSYKYQKPVSEETKRKMRISALNRVEKKGVAVCKDIGSKEFFEQINKLGFNFISKGFTDIGYVADGYDKEKHIWCEFDTPHHNWLYKKKKDLIRQENIIKYFESLGTPLKGFIRIQADKFGNILGTKCVYKGGK